MPFLVWACGKKQRLPDDVLLRYGDKYVTYSEIVQMIPAGISPADSVLLFNALVDSWLKDEVISDFAEDRLYDIEKIDRKVKDYRNNLIVLEYLNRMRESRTPKIDAAKVKEYYDLHRKELKLETPIVKGVFLKINTDIANKEEIKRLLSEDTPEKIDILEKDWLDRSLEYNYFRDNWIDWETIRGMIPYRFGDPDSFLRDNNYFETDYDDCSYFLKIAEWKGSGEEQPFEFAKTWIADLLTKVDLASYEISLVNSLIEKSINDNKLEIIGYDPLKHEILKQGNIRK